MWKDSAGRIGAGGEGKTENSNWMASLTPAGIVKEVVIDESLSVLG